MFPADKVVEISTGLLPPSESHIATNHFFWSAGGCARQYNTESIEMIFYVFGSVFPSNSVFERYWGGNNFLETAEEI
jgi:hypothetical protein